MTSPLANQMMFGERTVTVRARLGVTLGGGNQADGLTKICAGFVGLTPSDKELFSGSEYQVWECDIVIIPKKIYRDGPFKGSALSQVVTSLGGDLDERFKKIEEIGDI